MPAKNLRRIAEGGAYCHIYNRGVEGRNIFNDSNDYEAFQSFLKEYLTPRADPESLKKAFTVQGRIFQGTPHQPKNYLGQIELLGYRLRPNHFHLLLHQITPSSIPSFLRSLCTRYSIYFNKKYHRAGTLFEGPYKSVHIKNPSELLDLTCYIHRKPEKVDSVGNHYSSYSEYSGKKDTSWVKPEVALSFFDKVKNDSFKGVENYQDLVVKYHPYKEEKELLEGNVLEQDTNSKNIPPSPVSQVELPARIPETLAIIGVFLLLLGIGVKNIRATTDKVLGSSLATSTASPLPSPQEKPPVQIVTVKIEDGAESVNIRQNPTTGSEIVAHALDGDTFELNSENSDWYEVKLEDRTTGFISARYISKEKPN